MSTQQSNWSRKRAAWINGWNAGSGLDVEILAGSHRGRVMRVRTPGGETDFCVDLSGVDDETAKEIGANAANGGDIAEHEAEASDEARALYDELAALPEPVDAVDRQLLSDLIWMGVETQDEHDDAMAEALIAADLNPAKSERDLADEATGNLPD